MHSSITLDELTLEHAPEHVVEHSIKISKLFVVFCLEQQIWVSLLLVTEGYAHINCTALVWLNRPGSFMHISSLQRRLLL